LADIDETLGALTDLVAQGKVRYIGELTALGFDVVQLRAGGFVASRLEK
jgi:aryl-alcohol dehydrogenase-like predicted oxidoreductase